MKKTEFPLAERWKFGLLYCLVGPLIDLSAIAPTPALLSTIGRRSWTTGAHTALAELTNGSDAVGIRQLADCELL
jgi:hypothetical protein